MFRCRRSGAAAGVEPPRDGCGDVEVGLTGRRLQTVPVEQRAVRDVLESMLPVLDDIQGARDAGDLVEGPFAAIAEKLEGSLGKYGLVRYGAKGEAFDPTLHEALMHQAWPAGDADLAGVPADQGTTIVMVLQSGFRTGDQVIRPARVAVADSE